MAQLAARQIVALEVLGSKPSCVKTILSFGCHARGGLTTHFAALRFSMLSLCILPEVDLQPICSPAFRYAVIVHLSLAL